ncbi:MAG: response regulator transcription factor [Thermoanaerobaculia bacterium]|nr:response regulator transcription factor [Thermoanaerobaculia bacterium]
MVGETSPSVVVWIVEDNAKLRRDLATLLAAEADIEVALAVDRAEDALAALDEDPPPDVVLMDIGLPGMSGIDGTARLASRSPATRVVVLTVHGEDQKVFDAICGGACGYLLKPSAPERIVTAVRQASRGAAPMNAYIASKVLAMFARLAPRQPVVNDYGLTEREREILQLLVDGLTMQQIAGRLLVSYHTVDTHLRNIYEKLHVHTRSKAVAKALKEKLV